MVSGCNRMLHPACDMHVKWRNTTWHVYVLSVTCRFRENGSFSMVTRSENFAVLQVRRSEKVHYKYKHEQQWYFLTRTESEQCHVHLKEEAVPKDGSTVNIIFDESKYKELEVGAANCTELKCVLYTVINPLSHVFNKSHPL